MKAEVRDTGERVANAAAPSWEQQCAFGVGVVLILVAGGIAADLRMDDWLVSRSRRFVGI